MRLALSWSQIVVFALALMLGGGLALHAAPAFADDTWKRKIGLELVGNRDGPRPGSAAAVRGRECLVKVEMNHIDTHVSRTSLAYERVHVCAVHINKAAGIVQDSADLVDALFENSKC